MKTKYYYLHGFNSDADPSSEKSNLLKNIGDVVHLSYDSFDTYDNIMTHLTTSIKEKDISEVVFIGTSLGGFYAAELGHHFDRPSVMINPSINPYESLKNKCGEMFINYKNKNIRTLEQYVIDSYKNIKFSKNRLYQPFILLDSGDEMLDANATKKYFTKLKYPIVMFEGGNHRFEHMKESLELISKYADLSGCIFLEQE